jgi:hypothetical protein
MVIKQYENGFLKIYLDNEHVKEIYSNYFPLPS